MLSKVSLVAFTPNPDYLVARSALLCYSSKEFVNIRPSAKKTRSIISRLLKKGHLSPFEHASFTFCISDISRACLAQLTRHRIASYSVRSQRHVACDRIANPFPAGSREYGELETLFGEAKMIYRSMIQRGVRLEDARSVLPMSSATQLVMSINARSLFNLFAQRIAREAQEEVRLVCTAMLKETLLASPIIFEEFTNIHFGPNFTIN